MISQIYNHKTIYKQENYDYIVKFIFINQKSYKRTANYFLQPLYCINISLYFAIRLSIVCISSSPRKSLATIRRSLFKRKLAGIDVMFSCFSKRLR